jgi:hypothetical protein
MQRPEPTSRGLSMKGPSSRRLSLLRLRAAPELESFPASPSATRPFSRNISSGSGQGGYAWLKKPSGIPSLSGRTVEVSPREGQAAAHEMRAKAMAVIPILCGCEIRAAGRGGRDCGPTGPQGDAGLQEPAGPQVMRGEVGPAGRPGVPGAPGMPGTAGKHGRIGMQGSQGRPRVTRLRNASSGATSSPSGRRLWGSPGATVDLLRRSRRHIS